MPTRDYFVDLEEAFDRVPWKVIWWALRKLGVEELIVQMVQGMYANAWSHVGEGYRDVRGSVLSPLLFIVVLEAFTRVLLWGPLGGPLCQ